MVAAAATATELGIDDGCIPSQNGISTKPISISCTYEITTLPITNGELSNDQVVELVSLESTTYTSVKDMLPAQSILETYTSLKDMLPAQTPPTQSYSEIPISEIPIKNRLVQLAAWAYLQPMSNSSENIDGNIFWRLCVSCPVNCVNDQVDGCFVFMNEDVFPIIKRAFGGILRKITGGENIGI